MLPNQLRGFPQVLFRVVSESLGPECGPGQRDCGDHASGRSAPSCAAGGLLVSGGGWLGFGPRSTIGDLLRAVVLGLHGVLVLLDHGWLQGELEFKPGGLEPESANASMIRSGPVVIADLGFLPRVRSRYPTESADAGRGYLLCAQKSPEKQGGARTRICCLLGVGALSLKIVLGHGPRRD